MSWMLNVQSRRSSRKKDNICQSNWLSVDFYFKLWRVSETFILNSNKSEYASKNVFMSELKYLKCVLNKRTKYFDMIIIYNSCQVLTKTY